MTISYHSGERIQATQADFDGTPAVSGGWKELGRTTLGSSGDNISVASLPDKRYLMFLTYNTATGGDAIQRVRLNSDSGNNYARRNDWDGGGDSTAVNQPQMTQNNYALTLPTFSVGYFANKSDKEKLMISHTIGQNTAGAGTAPNRVESIGKWANTSNPISEVTMYNSEAGSYASGSECVVLGWDEDDTHTTNFWTELSSTSLSGSAGFLNSSQFTAKKYLWFQAYLKNSGSIQLEMKFGHGGNITTELEYASRISINGGTDDTSRVSKNSIQTEKNTSSPIFVNGFIVNNASNEKLCIMHEVIQNTAGAGNAPERVEFVGKWTDTTNQIDIIQMTDSGSGSFADGSTLKVWGSN